MKTYWIGGSGDWNDKSHWSLTSGGTGGADIPDDNDVVFDDNSGEGIAKRYIPSDIVGGLQRGPYHYDIKYYAEQGKK